MRVWALGFVKIVVIWTQVANIKLCVASPSFRRQISHRFLNTVWRLISVLIPSCQRYSQWAATGTMYLLVLQLDHWHQVFKIYYSSAKKPSVIGLAKCLNSACWCGLSEGLEWEYERRNSFSLSSSWNVCHSSKAVLQMWGYHSWGGKREKEKRFFFYSAFIGIGALPSIRAQ